MRSVTSFSDLVPAEQRAYDAFIEGTNVEGGLDGYRRLLEVVCTALDADHGLAGVQILRDLVQAKEGPKAHETRFLVWSQQHEAWWLPEGDGFTVSRSPAGVFTSEELEIYHLQGVGRSGQGEPVDCDVLVLVEE